MFHLSSQVARHCNRLFPPDISQAGSPSEAAERVKQKYVVLGRENERKKLKSKLELQMRAIYYDIIDPSAVEGYIASIYEQVYATQ